MSGCFRSKHRTANWFESIFPNLNELRLVELSPTLYTDLLNVSFNSIASNFFLSNKITQKFMISFSNYIFVINQPDFPLVPEHFCCQRRVIQGQPAVLGTCANFSSNASLAQT